MRKEDRDYTVVFDYWGTPIIFFSTAHSQDELVRKPKAPIPLSLVPLLRSLGHSDGAFEWKTFLWEDNSSLKSVQSGFFTLMLQGIYDFEQNVPSLFKSIQNLWSHIKWTEQEKILFVSHKNKLLMKWFAVCLDLIGPLMFITKT